MLDDPEDVPEGIENGRDLDAFPYRLRRRALFRAEGEEAVKARARIVHAAIHERARVRGGRIFPVRTKAAFVATVRVADSERPVERPLYTAHR